MKIFVSFLALAGLSSTIAYCPSDCKRDKGCVCASQESPLETAKTPQFVTLNFDDAVTDLIYKAYYEPHLFDRKNPDGSLITATFYVPHVYTDYARVNDLYNRGFEIAVDSISKNVQVEYWQNASLQTLTAEFQGQKKILEHFANILAKDIQGARTPHFQVAGNVTFEAYQQSGLSYDNSIPTLSNSKYFPYTLDYLSSQQFLVGVKPDKSFRGFWVTPIINLKSPENVECNVLLSCIGANSESNPTDGDWLISQFNNVYKSNRAPLNILLGQGWLARDHNLDAYVKFLNYVGKLKDVYLVSNSEVIRWAKDPKPLGKYKPSRVTRRQSCSPVSCPLKFGDQETRYMKSCVACPNVYPWVGNPLGN